MWKKKCEKLKTVLEKRKKEIEAQKEEIKEQAKQIAGFMKATEEIEEERKREKLLIE